jgi:hypothetical protein
MSWQVNFGLPQRIGAVATKGQTIGSALRYATMHFDLRWYTIEQSLSTLSTIHVQAE